MFFQGKYTFKTHSKHVYNHFIMLAKRKKIKIPLNLV
jgi:hypothetical protein